MSLKLCVPLGGYTHLVGDLKECKVPETPLDTSGADRGPAALWILKDSGCRPGDLHSHPVAALIVI